MMADGSRRFVRFNQVEIMEHWILLIAFLVMGLTGLMLLFRAWKSWLDDQQCV